MFFFDFTALVYRSIPLLLFVCLFVFSLSLSSMRGVLQDSFPSHNGVCSPRPRFSLTPVDVHTKHSPGGAADPGYLAVPLWLVA